MRLITPHERDTVAVAAAHAVQQPEAASHMLLARIGTTTVYIENVMLAETMQAIRCSTNAGTVIVDVYQGSTHLVPIFIASSTNGRMALTANTALAAGNLLKVDIGTPASSPRYVQCTIQVLR